MPKLNLFFIRHLNHRVLADFVDELLDVFYYINDIFNLNISSMNQVLANHLLQNLMIPLFRGSIVPSLVRCHTFIFIFIFYFLL